jgi:DUF1365 family protein
VKPAAASVAAPVAPASLVSARERTAQPVRDAQSALYRCLIRHQRTAPLRNGFGYRTHLWLVDLDDPPRLPAALRVLARFRAADHLNAAAEGMAAVRPGGPAAIKAELIRWCAQRGADVSGCRILMLTAARSLGHVFNPLTVYWCLEPDGAARYVVAEVHNTYGARHCYLLEPKNDRSEVDKRFYVSPFFAIEGGYRMTVPVPGQQLHVAVTLVLPDGSTPFVATVRGVRRPPGTGRMLRDLARDPLAGYRVPLAIRYQAIKLLLRGLRIQAGHRGPVPDSADTSVTTTTTTTVTESMCPFAPESVPESVSSSLPSSSSSSSSPSPSPSPSVSATGGARHGRHK